LISHDIVLASQQHASYPIDFFTA